MSILCRSISTRCCAFRAEAMSWFVIEPNALSSAPTFNRTTTVLLSTSSAAACASFFSSVPGVTAASCSRFASVSAPLPAATASLRRSRKLRPYPSATSFTSPARPRLSTSFVSKTRNSPDLRHGLIFVAVADSRTDSIDQTPHPMAGGTHSIADVAIPNALLHLQRLFVLAPDFLRARGDECLDREDPQRQHVQLAQHRYPGREVERAHDHAERPEQHRFRRRRNPLVAHQAVSQLAVSRHIEQDRFCPRKHGWHGGRQRLQVSRPHRNPINRRQATKGRRCISGRRPKAAGLGAEAQAGGAVRGAHTAWGPRVVVAGAARNGRAP